MAFMEKGGGRNKFGDVFRGWNSLEMKDRVSWQRLGRLLVMTISAGKAG